MLEIRPVTKDNWKGLVRLKVREDQIVFSHKRSACPHCSFAACCACPQDRCACGKISSAGNVVLIAQWQSAALWMMRS